MGEIVISLVAVIGLLVGGAAVYGQFRVSRNTSATNAYRDTALAYEAMHKAKDIEVAELTADLAAANARIEAQDAKIAMLQELVTSKALIEALSRNLDGHFTSIGQRLDDILAATGDISSRIAATQTGGQHG